MTSTLPARSIPSPAGLAGDGPSRWRSPRAAWVGALTAAGPALLVSCALFGWMLARSSAGNNTAGLQMPAMDLQHRVAYWWPFLMGEALGIAALVWAYLSVMAGLAFSTRSPRWRLSRRSVNDMHRQLSMTTVVLTAGHVLFVAVGSMNGAMTARTVDVPAALLPFQTSWNAQFYNVGIFAFYLSLLLGPTYYLRRWIGPRMWRIAHRASLAVYILAVWHTLGFDDFEFHGPYRLTLWVAQIPLAALLLWRLLAPARASSSGRPSRAPALVRGTTAVVTAAALGGLVALVAADRIGGGPSPFGHGGSGLQNVADRPAFATGAGAVGALRVTGAYIPQPANTSVAAAYFTVTDSGPADVLTGVTSDVGTDVGLHRTVENGATGTMVAVPSVPIPAHGTATLTPGGFHVMLQNPGTLAVGQQVLLTLHFAHTAPLTLQVPVVPLAEAGGMGAMSMG